jgi:RNA polymerase sigma-70 factor, ECF subfamily
LNIDASFYNLCSRKGYDEIRYKMRTEIASIWDNFHKELKAFIQNKTRNTADTEDILQDAFIRIIRYWDKVHHSQNVRLYLYGIVRNTMLDHFKHKKTVLDNSNMQELFAEEESQNLNTTVAECCIRPFINKLPEHYREALLITEFQNIPQKELAEKLGISYSGAKSRVQRGKEKLKELIMECCPYQSDIYGNIISNEKEACACS